MLSHHSIYFYNFDRSFSWMVCIFCWNFSHCVNRRYSCWLFNIFHHLCLMLCANVEKQSEWECERIDDFNLGVLCNAFLLLTGARKEIKFRIITTVVVFVIVYGYARYAQCSMLIVSNSSAKVGMRWVWKSYFNQIMWRLWNVTLT